MVATHNGEPTALYELRSLPGALSYQAAYASFRLRLEPPSLCRDLDQGLDGACPGRALATLGANLTRSSAVGIASDPRVSGTFHSFAADTPEEQAPLPWDHTWVANAWAVWSDPTALRFGRGGAGWELSGLYRMATGAPYRELQTNEWLLADVAVGETQRMDPTHRLDLRAALVMDTGRRSWALQVESFNALNGQAETSVVQTAGDDFGETATRQEPRWFRVGVEASW